MHGAHYHTMCAHVSHKAWDDKLLYKVCERRPRSQCVVRMAVSVRMFEAIL